MEFTPDSWTALWNRWAATTKMEPISPVTSSEPWTHGIPLICSSRLCPSCTKSCVQTRGLPSVALGFWLSPRTLMLAFGKDPSGYSAGIFKVCWGSPPSGSVFWGMRGVFFKDPHSAWCPFEHYCKRLGADIWKTARAFHQNLVRKTSSAPHMMLGFFCPQKGGEEASSSMCVLLSTSKKARWRMADWRNENAGFVGCQAGCA